MNPTRLLLIDDHPLLRRGVTQLLELEPDMAAVGGTSDGREAVALASQLHPDLILLDLNMPAFSGLRTLEALRDAGIAARVIVLTVSDCEEDITAALRAGAGGYLLKDMEPEDLVAHLRRAAVGEVVVAPELAGSLARALGAGHNDTADAMAHLTARERDLLRQLARGASNKLIARRLGITEGTTKVHMKNLLRKLGLRSRVEAAVLAVEHGLR